MTQLQVINLALAHMGNKAITQAQLTAGVVPEAVAANTFWEPCRDEVLGESRWSFATATMALSAIDTTDPLWDYIYSYPTTSVGSIWAVYDDYTVKEKEEQEFEVKYYTTTGVRAIYTNLDDAYAEYTYKVTDPAVWSDKFAMAFSYRLASSMSMYLTGDAQKGMQLMEIYNGILGEAKRIGNSEKVKVPPQTSKYQDAR